MKRTCDGCRASQYDRYYYKCTLGYNCSLDGKPQEQCPKPTTIKKFCETKHKMVGEIIDRNEKN